MNPEWATLLSVALDEARTGLDEGGIPIGAAVFDRGGSLLGRGHNRRVQDNDPSSHAETDAYRRAGRHCTWRDKVMVTTLTPCWYCSGLLRQFQFGTVVIGDAINVEPLAARGLSTHGIEVVVLDDPACIELMASWKTTHAELWAEDAGLT
jgi:cytosine deaminase